MAISIECGSCHRRFRAKDQHRGKRVNCPACQESLVIEGPKVSDHDVFVSHSAKDKVLADALVAELEQSRIRCWIAPRDVPPGATWGSAIVEAIENSRVMVLIYSSHSNSSRQVLREIERAVAKGVAVLPLRIDTVPMSKDLEYFLSACHWLDAMTPPVEEHLQRLTKVIRPLIQDAPAQEPEAAPAANDQNVAQAIGRFLPIENGAAESEASSTSVSPPAGRTLPHFDRRWAIGLGAALLLVILGIAVTWVPSDTPKKSDSGEQLPLSDVAPVKAAAEVAWERVREVARGETLGRQIDEGTALHRTAETLYAAKKWTDTISAYQKLLDVAERIEQADRDRTSATTVHSESTAALERWDRSGMEKVSASAPSTIVEARDQAAQGAQLFSNGNFRQAMAEWQKVGPLVLKAEAQTRAQRGASRAAQLYNEALAKEDAELLVKHGGGAWQAVTQAVAAARKATSLNEQTQSYEKATKLLSAAVEAAISAFVREAIADTEKRGYAISEDLSRIDRILQNHPSHTEAKSARDTISMFAHSWWIAKAESLVETAVAQAVAQPVPSALVFSKKDQDPDRRREYYLASRTRTIAASRALTGELSDSLAAFARSESFSLIERTQLLADVAERLVARGDFESALSVARTIGPADSAPVRVRIVRGQLAAGDLSAARQTVDKLTSYPPGSSQALFHILRFHLLASDRPAVQKTLDEMASRIGPRDPDNSFQAGALAWLGAAQRLAGDVPASVKAFKDARTMAAGYNDFYRPKNEREIAFAQLCGDYLAGDRSGTETIKKENPGLDLLVQFVIQQGDYVRAREFMGKMMGGGFRAQAQMDLAESFGDTGAVDAAKAELALVPSTFGRAHRVRARVEVKAGQVAEVVRWVETLRDAEMKIYACCGAAEGLYERALASTKESAAR